jgi:methyltransferase (TIGR00027 family)
MIAAAPRLNAQRIALSRALHQMVDAPRIFEDPLAAAIVGGEIGIPVESQSREMSGHRAFMAAQSRYVEDELNAAVARGATQYVILGAGLDTYAYRNQNKNLRVFEVDHPATQEWKRTRLDAAGIAIPPSLAFVPTHFEERSLPSALHGEGFRAGEVSFFSWVGVSPYASAETTLGTLAFIGSLPAGSGAVFDYVERRSAADPAEETAMDALASRFAGDGESPELIVDSNALYNLLRCAGFHEVEDLEPVEIARRYFGNRGDEPRVPAGLARLVSGRV